MTKKIYFSMSQRNFDLIYALEMSKNYPGVVLENDYKDLEERIGEVSKRMRNRSEAELGGANEE